MRGTEAVIERATDRRPPVLLSLLLFAFAAFFLLAPSLIGIVARAQPLTPADAPTSRPPRQWATEIAANEIALLQNSATYLRYRMHIVDQKGDLVRDVIESRDGTVARLIERNGQPLTPEENAAERQRLNDMIASPESYARHIQHEASNKKMAANLIREMPDAMIYTYTPGQPQTEASLARPEKTGEQVVMDFHPNPDWTPPTTMAEALTGLEGRIWIDVEHHQMVRMEGHIFKPVNFGWGMLAHIYPGGNLLLEQANVGQERWIYTHFTQDVSVRALMMKTLKVNTRIDATGFQILPGPIAYQDAIKQLLATP